MSPQKEFNSALKRLVSLAEKHGQPMLFVGMIPSDTQKGQNLLGHALITPDPVSAVKMLYAALAANPNTLGILANVVAELTPKS